MKTVDFQICESIPVIAETEVLVVGGGAGGFSAAVMAARCGARTILAEQHGSLGGTTTYAEISPMMPNDYSPDGIREHAKPLDGPVYIDWLQKMYRSLPPELRAECSDVEHRNGKNRIVSKDIAALAMEELCQEAGVQLLYHFSLFRLLQDGRRITGAVFHTKAGLRAVLARTFIDASGDGNLALAAGCRYEMGDREHGLCQPMTLCFKLSHVNPEACSREEVQRLFEEAKGAGVIDTCREDLLRFGYYDEDVVHFNATRVIGKSPLDPLERSLAEEEGRRQMRQIVEWLRSSVPGYEQARIHSMGSEIGVRESRRILGLAYLDTEAFRDRAHFPDAIARCNYPIDIHSATGSGTKIVAMGVNEFFEIPYGCIVAADVDNLLMAGRPISVSHEIHASTRVMPPACSIGQAAGAAAALSIRKNTPPCHLDGCEVRRELIIRGADLN